ncbi:MAG: lytic murein transglycosylase [Pseudomonadota bacterium]
MRILGAALAVVSLSSVGAADAPSQSQRPSVRPLSAATSGDRARPQTRAKAVAASFPTDTGNARFDLWLTAFRGRAMAQGISADTLDRALAGVTYSADAIRRDANQAEFSKAIWEYLDSAVSDTRIRNGKSALGQYRARLDAIEQRYGVRKEVVTAVWGLESAYGSFRGSDPVVSSMATLAFDGRRGAFFESQLIAVLRILQAGDTTPDRMTGSWAGAMGHTQFMPTSYLDYAVDFDGDGRRDIWSDDPTDALASTAAYLKAFGWVSGQPWGVEVRLPEGFDYAQADRKIERSPAAWARLGVAGVTGGAVANHGPASILLPAGGKGPAFMIFKNFEVLERYNTADAYVIGVGHLSDRIAGGPAIAARWPREDRALTFAERKEMQRHLTAAGFSTQGVDGRIGPLTIAAIRNYQQANGLLPDGYASLSLLTRLR